MDEKKKMENSSINSCAQNSSDVRTKQASGASSEVYHPRRDVLLMEEPKKCYLLRELTTERATIEKGMLDVDRLILKLFTSGVLDFISLNNITRNPVRNDRTRALLDHFLQLNNNGILRQFVSHMRDSVILNAEALNWAEYMQGCSDSCCMFFIKKYGDVFKYVLEEYGVKRFNEYFLKSGMLTESESKDLCKYSYKEGAERFMHILFTKKTILCVADMWFTLVEHKHDIPYLGPYINSFLKAFDEQTGPFCPQFDPQLPVKPLLKKRCYVNLYRLLHLIHVEGTEVVRRIFDTRVSAEELEEEITKNKVLIKNRLEGPDFSNFKKKWINIIYSTDKSKTLHFTLPIFQFLAVFMKKFPRPKKGWTGRLAKSDTSPGAYLRRICEMRDHLLKDILHRCLSYEKFDRMWNEASEILGQLGADEKRLQELRMQPMSIVFVERRYMEKYFNKPLSELLEELIVKQHKGIDSVCACSLAKDTSAEQKLEDKVAEAKVAEPKVAEIKVAETKVAEAKVAETKVAETKVAETKVAETKVAETKVAITKVAETKVAETKVAEAKVADTKMTDSKEEQKGKDTSEDESLLPAAVTGESKSKKRRKKSRKRGKKSEVGPQAFLQDVDVLQELKSAPTQNTEIPKDQTQEITEKTEATETALKSEQSNVETVPDPEDSLKMPAPCLVSAASPTESCDSKGRSEDESETETIQEKISNGMVNVYVNTDDVDFKETFKRIEAERTELTRYIEDLRDSCKQIENESYLEIKGWKQRIQEQEKENAEESNRMDQEQINHQTQLQKVMELIRVKKAQCERYVKSLNDKNEELLKLKKELENEQEKWCYEQRKLDVEISNAQQTETENIKKAISQECLLLEMRRDFLLSNLEEAVLETEHQLSMLMDKTKGPIADPSHIQATVNKWDATAADLRSKIEYIKKNFNNHIQLIKNGAKLSDLPELINPEPQYPLALHVPKSGKKTSSPSLPLPQHSLHLHSATNAAAAIVTPASSQLHGYRHRSGLSNFDEPGKIEKKSWMGVEYQQLLQHQESTEEDPCVICHEELVPHEDCYELECKHTFHKKCIDYWLKEQSTCPICRILVLKPEDYPQLPKK
ncbi:E3 ubiquitin-protein ligase DZIP3-like isoform X2 [Hemitrygon akajei]|uniref:E3 ubiquitin-protein ligase DZIP3-like isoform X2 n=1 Tax=Hemitrygon akajei TaxID=2704970 RepID=UPI003BF98AAC